MARHENPRAPLIVTGAQKSASTSVAKWFGEIPGTFDVGRESAAFDGVLRTALLRARLASIGKRGLVPVVKRSEVLHNATLCRRAAAAFPSATAVAVLRDPVQRSVSAWRHYQTLGVLAPDVALRDCVASWQETGSRTPAGQIIGYSIYAASVRRLRASFGLAAVAFDEEVLSDPRTAFDAVLEQFDLGAGAAPTLPRLNTSEEVAKKAAAIPARLAGRMTYRWDHGGGFFAARPIGWRAAAVLRTAAHSLGMTVPTATRETTTADLDAVFAVVSTDFERLEHEMDRSVPAGWHRG